MTLHRPRGSSRGRFLQLTKPLIENLKERYPLYLTPSSVDDHRPNETSWTVFKKHLESKEKK